ncbi:hypothetical protein [Geminocystis sp. NIES-3709]|uniref:hypothetical protein n=1 Tax=Geminocystis sp. NIES-3709 TaxID=1617448 RepID=UPI0005FC3D66|nr:hypothetical protein [Geminocystis sp. NIES-3709]BAQ67087.1 hypothetical protein GM3709_3852 [Geminocystis sp. NIES-3709]
MYLFKKEIRENIADLQKEYGFTAKEAVVIAVQMEHNELLEEQNKLLKQAYVISNNNSYPSAIENIAIQLGATQDKYPTTIINILEKIKQELSHLASR